MRALYILSGIAVLLTTLAFGHLVHHYYLNASPENLHEPLFMVGMAAGILIGTLSFLGGCLLVRRGR